MSGVQPERKLRISLEETLKLFKEVHGDRYDYSKFILINQNTKGIIICKKHGEFLQSPRNHKEGKGCPTCNKGGPGLQDEIIERFKKVHSDTYDYSKVKYKNYNTPVEIVCKIHGSFFQKPFNHYRGNGCPKCSVINKRLDIDKRLEQFNTIHNFKYTYPNIDKEYTNTLTKIGILCPVESHDIFYQLPVNHFAGSGCPKCNSNKKEEFLNDSLKEYNINYIYRDRTIISPLEIDILIPDFKFGIEHNGLFWHSYGKSNWDALDNYNNLNKNRHLEKTIKMEEQGYQLFHIREDHLLNKKKKDIWKSVLLNKCGFSNKIHARKLQIVNLSNYSDFVTTFLENNHLQGSCSSSIKLGLQDSKTGVIYSIMTFGKSRFNKNIEYELLRFCNAKFFNVRGAASKLLKAFEKYYKPESIVSYANRDWSQGNLYKQLGFEYSHASEPNYVYIDCNFNIIPRQQVQKHKLKEFLESRNQVFIENLSERDNMINNGYRIYYDTGNLVYHKIY